MYTLLFGIIIIIIMAVFITEELLQTDLPVSLPLTSGSVVKPSGQAHTEIGMTNMHLTTTIPSGLYSVQLLCSVSHIHVGSFHSSPCEQHCYIRTQEC